MTTIHADKVVVDKEVLIALVDAKVLETVYIGVKSIRIVLKDNAEAVGHNAHSNNEKANDESTIGIEHDSVDSIVNIEHNAIAIVADVVGNELEKLEVVIPIISKGVDSIESIVMTVEVEKTSKVEDKDKHLVVVSAES